MGVACSKKHTGNFNWETVRKEIMTTLVVYEKIVCVFGKIGYEDEEFCLPGYNAV
jgi:hypothetical protein